MSNIVVKSHPAYALSDSEGWQREENQFFLNPILRFLNRWYHEHALTFLWWQFTLQHNLGQWLLTFLNNGTLISYSYPSTPSQPHKKIQANYLN